MRRLLKFACLLVLSTPAFATFHAVSVAGAGSHTGADWNNSFIGLPSTLVRGDVYCLADGTYSGYTFNTAVSGTTTIEIRKAQSYDTSGCEALAGWNTSTMGSAQAVFPKFTISTDFIILNGNGTQSASGCGGALSASSVTTGPPTPLDCGLKIDNTGCSSNCANPFSVTFNAGLTSMLFEYMEWHGNSTPAANEDVFFTGFGNSGITWTHIYGHDAGAQYQQYGGQNSSGSFSYFWETQRQGVLSDGQHGQAEEYCCTDSNAVRHHNVYRDITGTAVWSFVQIGSGGTLNNWEFYDNIVWNSTSFTPGGSLTPGKTTNGILACINATVVCTNFVFNQNTTVNKGYNAGITLCDTASGCTATIQNNLWYQTTNTSGVAGPPAFAGNVTLTQNHNSFLTSGTGCASGTSNVCDNSASNPFTSWTTGDFSLASDAADWNNRISLSSPYNTDFVGNAFTTDRGAYQFESGSPTFTCSPATIPSEHSNNISLSCTGSGTSWTGGTAFSVSGVTGTTLVSSTNNSATSQTLVVTTGSGTGTETIDDTTDSITTTIAVSAATLSISPTSASPGSGGCTTACQTTLTLTGTNTLWSSETPSGLFTESGGTGASIGTPTVTSNTSATAVLTYGSSAASETITDTSTTATATFTVASPTLPTVTTGTAGSLGAATVAVTGSSYTCTGSCGAPTSEGVCYATTSNPTTPCTSDGTATPFNSSLTGLAANTTYFYRAFAANAAGTAYGSSSSFTTPEILYVTGAGNNGSSSSNTFTFSYTATATSDAVAFAVFCHGASVSTSATLTASGWTTTSLIGPTSNGTGTATLFGAIAPNTSAATFTAEFFTGGSTPVPCASFDAYMIAEFSGNNTSGGTTTFPAVGSSGATTGGCNQTAANITPTSVNNGVWNACYASVVSGIAAPWTAAATDGTGGDLSEYQVLSGGSGVAKTPAYGSSSGFYSVVGTAISPNNAPAPPTALTGVVLRGTKVQ
jgi:hypothetical protein